jgi:hypothetical protein
MYFIDTMTNVLRLFHHLTKAERSDGITTSLIKIKTSIESKSVTLPGQDLFT